jgi:Spy/CpxP family protein refolding chaperone
MGTRSMVAACLLAVGIALMAGISWAEGTAAADQSPGFGSPIARLITGNIGRLLVLRSELNVTSEQRAKIRSAVKSHRDEIRPVAASIVQKKRALREAVLTKNEEAIRSASADLGKSIGDASVVASKVVADVRKVLTPEQIEKIQKFRADADGAADRWLNEIGK